MSESAVELARTEGPFRRQAGAHLLNVAKRTDAVVLAGVMLIPRTRRLKVIDRFRSPWQWSAAAVLSTLVLLVATSRLHLQAHWPSDVLAGLLVAVLWAGVAAAIVRGYSGRVR